MNNENEHSTRFQTSFLDLSESPNLAPVSQRSEDIEELLLRLRKSAMDPIETPCSTSAPARLRRHNTHSSVSVRGARDKLLKVARRASMSVRHNAPKPSYEKVDAAFYDDRDLASHERPVSRASSKATGWIKRATSFRHRPSFSLSRPQSSLGDAVFFRSSPIPGSGSAPPVLPDGNAGGAAARAAAAAENERLIAGRVIALKEETTGDRDAESGIGIDMQCGGRDSFRTETVDPSMVRKDPVYYLPSELIEHILSFLDHRSLIRAELVSSNWQAAASSRHVWRSALFNEHCRGTRISPRQLGTFTGGRGIGNNTANQDWKRMFAIRNQLTKNWNSGACTGKYLLGHTDSVYCIQFDDEKIISGSRDRTVRVWDIRTQECIKVIGPSQPLIGRSVYDASLHTSEFTDGSLAIRPHYISVPQLAPSPVSDDIVSPRTSSSDFHHASILCLDFDKDILVTGSSDSTAIVWSIKENYKPIRRLAHHTLGVLDVCFDHKYIITCSKDFTICVWSRETGELLRQLFGHKGPVNAVQMREHLLVSTSGDAMIKLWNIQSGKCIREFAGHSRGLACVQFSEDSRLILSGGNDHVIRVWDANTGECIKDLEGHRKLVRSLHLDLANSRVISGSYDHTVKVFDLESGRCTLDFRDWTAMWVLSSKADYRRLVCTSQDGKIMLLDFGASIPDCDLLGA